ncbi:MULTISPECIES: hypothetical protein [unclassified Myroides]|uniref:hypothetical protein n=1 Tax=unclassified Myroides TaxID=2642485 RepID=UPI003D2F8726
MSVFLSVDPHAEKYPNINPYVYVANNPINAIDPDGRDIIHLNGKGSITKVVNDNKSHITIMDGGKVRSLSDYSIGKSWFGLNSRDRQSVANIVGYYANQIGVEGVGATNEVGGIAHYNSNNNKIWIAPVGDNGTVSSLLNDKNNLMNVLVHEREHRIDNANGVITSFESHVDVYVRQMSDESFSGTTEDFQKGMISAMASYLGGIRSRSTRSELINKFNSNNVGGYKLEDFKSGYGYGLEKNGEKKYFDVKTKKEPN